MMLSKKETYPSKIAQIIRTMIREGELKPGDAVKEQLLSAKLSLSRAPIREALQELAHEGLVTSKPQKGKRVRELTSKEILDSYAVGAILEATGVSESLHLWTKTDRDKLEEIVLAMEKKSLESCELGSMMELDDLFHTTLLQRCTNLQLISMARNCCSSISKVLCYQICLYLISTNGFYKRHERLAKLI